MVNLIHVKFTFALIKEQKKKKIIEKKSSAHLSLIWHEV